MLNLSRKQLVEGLWFALVALLTAYSVARGANFSTSVMLFVMGVVPVAVIMLLSRDPTPPSVAQILRSVDTKKGRS